MMRTSFRLLGLIALLLAGWSTLSAQSRVFTLAYDPAEGSPAATLDQVAWIAGFWEGGAFGGKVEEFWSPPVGNSMMGCFKLTVDGKDQFLELFTISEIEESLILRLKHFHADLKGWEEKEETVDFPLVKIVPGKVYFDGFTFERVSKNRINLYVLIENGGKAEEVKFAYSRQKLR